MNKYLFFFVALLLVFWLSVPVWGVPTHIHLSWQEDPRYTIVVSWRTANQEASWVQYGEELPYDMNASGSSGTIHHVALGDLEPDTTYHYRCGSELGWSGDFTFKTAPSDPSEAFTFVALGDSRTNWQTCGECSEATHAADPEFVVHTGDVVAHGSDQNEWNVWFDEATILLRETVFMPAIGNHEENAPNYYQQFALPHNEDWYSFDYGNAHFIALSTEKSMIGSQRTWLEQDLASTNATWIFVYYHRPMYSSGSHGPERPVYYAWGDLFDEYHVDMVFNGHDHCYERTHPMADDWVADSPDNGTIHVVTGGAGAPLYGMVAEGPWSAKFLKINHFVLLTINGTELHMEARFLNQTVFDEITISKAILPDLTIQSISTDPKYPIPGETATIEMEIINAGKLTSPASRVTVEVNGGVLGEAEVESLEPGDIAFVSMEWSPTIEGYHDIEVMVDGMDQVFEGIGEDNNAGSLGVLASVPKPDLVIGSIKTDALLPDVGETITFTIEVINEGTKKSDPFKVQVELGLELLRNLEITFNETSGLEPDERMEVHVPWTCESGDWEIVAVADPEGAVEEIFEENNNASRTFHYRDFQKVGPAYLPQGFGENEMVVIYYNQSYGEIPENSTTCTLVWGINGWKRPPNDMAPMGTVRRKAFETEMVQVSTGLWLVSIPTDDRFEWIDLKFEDRQFLPKYWDDNGGEDWIIPGESWAYGKIDDLLAAMEEAEDSGVDVSPYWDLLSEVNLSLMDRQYLDAALILINATNHCMMTECELLLEKAMAEYQLAMNEGLDVARVENFLIAAQAQLDSGNYGGSKQFIETSLRRISEAREKVPQRIVVPFVVLLATFTVVLSRREKARRSRTLITDGL